MPETGIVSREIITCVCKFLYPTRVILTRTGSILFRKGGSFDKNIYNMKTKITTPFILQYRTYEVIDLMGSVVRLYKSSENLDTLLVTRVSELEQILESLKEEYQKKRGHFMTKEIEKLDKERKGKIKGVRWFLESQQYRESEEKVKAAGQLMISYRRICKKLEQENYNEATATISKLMRLWTKDPSLMAAADVLDIRGWIENIQQVNEEFNHKLYERTTKKERKQNSYPIKLRIKAAYEALIRDTSAFIFLADGNHPYDILLAEVNQVVKKFNTSYNIRQGIRESKKRKGM